MRKVGLTGGIGSGKSTVAEIFRRLGVPVFSSDAVARKLQDEDENLRKEIQRLFGKAIYGNDGKLNRKKAAELAFSDNSKLEQLNNIVHPAVRKAFAQFCNENATADYVVNEAAIFFETGNDKNFDAMITVTAPVEVRVMRVALRDGISREQILQRMKNQWEDAEKIRLSKFVIANDGKQLLLPRVVEIDRQLREI